MPLEFNKSVVMRFLDEVQSQHNLDIVDEIMSPTMIDHFYDAQGLPQPPNAIEAFKTFYSGMLSSFPDLQVIVHDMMAEKDKVCTYKTFTGTHLGPFRGIPPTGNKIAVKVMDIFRLSNGKLVEHWVVADWMGLMQQIGAIPGPPNR